MRFIRVNHREVIERIDSSIVDFVINWHKFFIPSPLILFFYSHQNLKASEMRRVINSYVNVANINISSASRTDITRYHACFLGSGLFWSILSKRGVGGGGFINTNILVKYFFAKLHKIS